MARIAEAVQEWLGWCPMRAGAVQREKKSGEEPGEPRVADAGSGPVAVRAARYTLLMWAVVALSWLAAIAALPHLPEVVPVHWNLYGEPDGFAGRVAGAFFLPAILTLTALLLVLMPRFERMNVSLRESRDIYAIITFAAVLMLFCIQVTTLLAAAGVGVPMETVVPVVLGLFFIVIGGLLPHVGRNTTMGFRFPWTLRSDRVWRETHEHGGRVFIAAGVLVVLACPVAGIWGLPLLLAAVFGATLYIVVWSYRLSRAVPAGE